MAGRHHEKQTEFSWKVRSKSSDWSQFAEFFPSALESLNLDCRARARLMAAALQDPQIVNQIVTREYADESAALHHRELIDSVPLHLFDGRPRLCVRWRRDELVC